MGKKTLSTNAMLESEDEFVEAYEAYSPRIFRFLFWRTKNNELSKDLTSSVFEKAWRSRGSFRGGSVQAWLYKIARNVLTDHWRTKQDLPVEDISILAEATEDSAARLDTLMEVERLARAVQKLPKEMREVVNLRFIEGWSSKDVAKHLNLSESNVRVIQYRALRRIRNELS
jgi:RNA polymerase sigma-70 factor (ECF subfamily)